MNNHFYVTLPSDSSANYYPNNTVARFVTKLSERIRLEGDYEMALAEIIYPHSWYNVDNTDGKYWFAAARKEQSKFGKVFIPSGYYESGSAFASAVNNLLDVVFDPIDDCNVKVIYNETIGRFSLTVRSTGSHVFVMSDDLQRYMGFDLSSISVDAHSFSTIAKQTFDANPGLNLMYVYCDVAAHTVVGDTKTPLLRVCNVAGKHGNMVRYTYIQPHYVPVGRREFDTIEIAINNELGKSMPFEYGKSVVTLHFRRRHGLLTTS